MITKFELTVHGITYTWDSLNVAPNNEEQFKASISLFADNIRTVEAYLNAALIKPDVPANQPSPYSNPGFQTPANNGQGVSEDMEVTHIRHDFSDNKHMYRLIGGKWSKFGVAIYPEVIADSELKNFIFGSPMGDTPLGAVASVYMKDGKPIRIQTVRLKVSA